MSSQAKIDRALRYVHEAGEELRKLTEELRAHGVQIPSGVLQPYAQMLEDNNRYDVIEATLNKLFGDVNNEADVDATNEADDRSPLQGMPVPPAPPAQESSTISQDPSERQLAEASGDVTIKSAFVSFVYELLRDHLTAGEVEKALRNSLGDPNVRYTNGFLAQYAKYVVEQLARVDEAHASAQHSTQTEQQAPEQRSEEAAPVCKCPMGCCHKQTESVKTTPQLHGLDAVGARHALPPGRQPRPRR